MCAASAARNIAGDPRFPKPGILRTISGVFRLLGGGPARSPVFSAGPEFWRRIPLRPKCHPNSDATERLCKEFLHVSIRATPCPETGRLLPGMR